MKKLLLCVIFMLCVMACDNRPESLEENDPLYVKCKWAGDIRRCENSEVVCYLVGNGVCFKKEHYITIE